MIDATDATARRDRPLATSALWVVASFAMALAFPLVAAAVGGEFYVGLASRILIMGLAVTGLNLALGYGGLISLGHAAFLGAGAYTVAILMHEGIGHGWLALVLAVVVAAVLALAIGALSLRTQGAYFIMLTLAFAQMLYYLIVSLPRYNGDDGLNLARRSIFGLGIDPGNDMHLYWLVLVICAIGIGAMTGLARSRFGIALQAVRDNPVRAEAIGLPVFRIRLIAFTVSGAVTGLAGALLANHSQFAGPGMMYWTQSGILMVMAIMGGVGRPLGGIVGAAAYLLLEEVANGLTEFWGLALGLVLLVIVMAAPQGLTGLIACWRGQQRHSRR